MSLPRLSIRRWLRIGILNNIFRVSSSSPTSNMGLLVNGKWVPDDQAPPNLTAPYKNKLGTSEFPFDPAKEPGRYHLYTSFSCPFAQRSVLARSYYNLESAIGLSIVDPRNTDEGWSFTSDDFPNVGDRILGKKLLQEVYLAADPNYTGRVSVPLLIDTKPGDHSLGGSGKIRIISGESADLVDEFEKVSKSSAAAPQDPPAGPNLVGAVIQAKKAQDPAVKEEHLDQLHKSFEKLDAELANKSYLGGGDISAVDFKVFPFLVQVETLSSIVLETSPKIGNYKNLKAYAHRVYENPNVKKNIHLDQTRAGMYRMMSRLNISVVRNVEQLQDPDWFNAAA